jgi:hypothetical protein
MKKLEIDFSSSLAEKKKSKAITHDINNIDDYVNRIKEFYDKFKS